MSPKLKLIEKGLWSFTGRDGSRYYVEHVRGPLPWELRKLGAAIDIEDAHHASIHGPARLHGAEASIGDLRAGASLILAALSADGASLIHGAHHVHRGYENIDRKFQQLGAIISRSADSA